MSAPIALAVRAAIALTDVRRDRLTKGARRLSVDERSDLHVAANLDIDRLAGTSHNHTRYGLVTS